VTVYKCGALLYLSWLGLASYSEIGIHRILNLSEPGSYSWKPPFWYREKNIPNYYNNVYDNDSNHDPKDPVRK
jgi:hypothetical protein